MDDSVKIAFVLVYAYLLGSVNAAYVVGRVVKGVDLRTVGSKNMGASNVWQQVGRFWLFPVGAFDMFVKGMTPVYLARYGLGLELEWQAAAGLLAIAGHNWSVFLGFQGGRGIAPMVGVLIAMARLELAMFIIIATMGWRLTGSSAVWVLIALASLPVWAALWERPGAIVALTIGILVITVVKRLAANSPDASGIPTAQLLLNRLLYDRDIADHEQWVTQGGEGAR